MSTINYSKLRELRAKKKKYYLQKEEDGEMLYGMGKDFRLSNTIEDRKKRQYGFTRTTVLQKHRLQKYVIEFRKNKSIRCYKRMGYIWSPTVNKLYKSNNINKIFEILYTTYQHLDPLLEDYGFGFKDPIFYRIISLTGIFKDDIRMDIFLSNYNDILTESLMMFISEIDNYVESQRVTFYSYAANIIPYRFMSLFLNILNDRHEYVDMDEFADETYNIESSYNPIGVYIIKHFKRIKK